MIKKIFSMLGIGLLVVVVGLVIVKGVERQERVECQQWVKDSQQYQGWYSTEWQKEQCLSYGIELK